MNAKQGTILLAAQLNGLLCRLNKDMYTRPLPLFNGSTIGQHIRHIVECYQCLFDGISKAHVDYSSRSRNTNLSNCPRTAQVMVDYIAQTVKRLDEHQWLKVESEFPETSPFPGKRPVFISSTGRELQYAFDHAVHHLAIIRMGLEVYNPEFSIDADLGVAPSTVKYRNATTAQTVRETIPETTYG